MAGPLDVKRLGRVPYDEALALQLELVERRRRDEAADTLLLLEHDPVFTLGRGADRSSLPRDGGVPVRETTRGGDATYHGPGQLVAYWIRKLAPGDRDMHAHLRRLEEALIRTVADLGVAAGRREGLTGVWVGERKVASIGVAVRSWVTFHGAALNVAVDPEIYTTFRPCGLDGAVMTDLASVLGEAPPRAALEAGLARHVAEVGGSTPA